MIGENRGKVDCACTRRLGYNRRMVDSACSKRPKELHKLYSQRRRKMN